MILLWACLVISSAAHRVTESVEDIPNPGSNTTTLYPVSAVNRTEKSKISSSATWKIETTFSGRNLTDSNSTESKEITVEQTVNGSKEFKPSQHLGSYVELTSPEVSPTKEPFGFSPVIKKPPVGFFGSPDLDKKIPFKFPKEIFKNYNEFPYKIEKAIYTRAKNPTEDPWKPSRGMEPTPTHEAPTKLPAGGLYKLPDAFKESIFKERPSFSDDDLGLEFSDAKDHALKKRGSPWKKLLHFITALVPVGIIFSALTPNVVTIESGPPGAGSQLVPLHPPLLHHDPGRKRVRALDETADVTRRGSLARSQRDFLPDTQRPYRQVDATSVSSPKDQYQAGIPTPPTLVSERCRRRLMCELQADYNYNPKPGSRRNRCHRIHCEDPQALADTLDFLLSYHQSRGPNRQGGPVQGRHKH